VHTYSLPAYHITKHPCQILGSLRKYKSERHNRKKDDNQASFGAVPVWIGSVLDSPTLNLLTSLFLSLIQAALKACFLWKAVPDQLSN
jgi:hypothetical protein